MDVMVQAEDEALEIRECLKRIEEVATRLSALKGARSASGIRLANELRGVVKASEPALGVASGEPHFATLKVDHTGIAVKDLAAAARLFVDFLGAKLTAGGINHDAELRTLFVEFPGGGKFEFLQPTGENPIHHFLEKRGEGVHHITILVRDVVDITRRLKEAGYRVVDEDFSQPGWKEAYISPRSALGCVLQLVEVSPDYGKPVDGVTIEDVLADRWEWVDQKPRRRSD